MQLTIGLWVVVLISIVLCSYVCTYVIDKIGELDLTPQHPDAKKNKAKLAMLITLFNVIVFFGYWFSNLVISGNIKIKI